MTLVPTWEDGTLKFSDKLCIPKVKSLKREIIEETHYSTYSIHLGITKICRHLRGNYWWPGKKK